MLKLLPLYLFVAMFWALFDQTGSTWIFQSQDMDRHFLGFEWLPSQIQSLNSVFVLTFIPLFAYIIYPLGDRMWKLTPLRKIGLGLFIMVGSFALVALIQQWIDGGARPNIVWQILAFALLTIAEVMVSIVALEYAYTQAPRTMKSLIMCFYLGAVAIGNFLVAGVNHFIQIPDAARNNSRTRSPSCRRTGARIRAPCAARPRRRHRHGRRSHPRTCRRRSHLAGDSRPGAVRGGGGAGRGAGDGKRRPFSR